MAELDIQETSSESLEKKEEFKSEPYEIDVSIHYSLSAIGL